MCLRISSIIIKFVAIVLGFVMWQAFIYFKTIKLAIATTLIVNVRVPFNFTTWNKVVYTSGYVITYIIKTTEPNHSILILNLANKSYFITRVNFCNLLAWFKNYDALKVGVNLFGTRCIPGSLMSVRRTSFKDSSTYRSVFTACLLFGDWAYVDVLTSITLLSPEWFLGFLLGAIGYISVDNFANFGHRAAPFSASL